MLHNVMAVMHREFSKVQTSRDYERYQGVCLKIYPPFEKIPPFEIGVSANKGGIFSNISDSRRVPPSGLDLVPRSGENFEDALPK